MEALASQIHDSDQPRKQRGRHRPRAFLRCRNTENLSLPPEMIILYTAIFGGSDSLKRAPAGPDRCVCFTDDPAIFGQGWEIVRPSHYSSGRRAARILKLTPDDLFPDASASIWVDGSIEIRDFTALIADAAGADIACLAHPDRSTCYEEGEAVVRLRIAHRSKVSAALALYRRDGFAPTSLSTTGLLYRRRGPKVAVFNRLWREHLDLYGTNDQVHIDYCAFKTGVPIAYLRGHYRDNPYARYDQVDHHRRRKPQFRLEADCEHYLA
jgi:hypothetical protein